MAAAAPASVESKSSSTYTVDDVDRREIAAFEELCASPPPIDFKFKDWPNASPIRVRSVASKGSDAGRRKRRIAATLECMGYHGLFIQMVGGFSIANLPLHTVGLLMDLQGAKFLKEWLRQPRNPQQLRHFPLLTVFGIRQPNLTYRTVLRTVLSRTCDKCQRMEYDIRGAVDDICSVIDELQTKSIEKIVSAHSYVMWTQEAIDKMIPVALMSKLPSGLASCPCDRAYYCNAACQKADWAKHRNSMEHNEVYEVPLPDPKSQSQTAGFYVVLLSELNH
jgi:hypothetical protein